MPNLCWNHLTIICKDNIEQLEKMYENEFSSIEDKHIEVKTNNGLQISVCSVWEPLDLNKILDKYNRCWVKNEWEEEGGTCGIFVGGYLNGESVETQSLDWVDLSIEGKYHYLNKSWYR